MTRTPAAERLACGKIPLKLLKQFNLIATSGKILFLAKLNPKGCHEAHRKDIMPEATFSRAFAAFAASNLGGVVHDALVGPLSIA